MEARNGDQHLAQHPRKTVEFRNFKLFFAVYFLPIIPLSTRLTVLYWLFHGLNMGIHVAGFIWPSSLVISMQVHYPSSNILHDITAFTSFFYYTIRMLIMLTNYIWVTFNRAHLVALFQHLEREFLKMSLSSKRIIRRKSQLAFLAALTCTTTYVSYGILQLYLSLGNLKEGSGPFPLFSPSLNIVMIVLHNSWYIFAAHLYATTVIFFTFICHFLNEILEEPSEKAKQRLQSNKSLESRLQIDNIISRFMTEHRTASKMVERVDSTFTVLNSLTLSMELVSLICVFRIAGISISKCYSQIFFPTILTLLMFMTKCLVAASVNYRVLKTIDNIPGIDVDVPTDSTWTQASTQVLGNLQIYVTKFSISPPALSVIRIFPISRGLLLTALGTVVTYTLILYQNK